MFALFTQASTAQHDSRKCLIPVNDIVFVTELKMGGSKVHVQHLTCDNSKKDVTEHAVYIEEDIDTVNEILSKSF